MPSNERRRCEGVRHQFPSSFVCFKHHNRSSRTHMHLLLIMRDQRTQIPYIYLFELQCYMLSYVTLLPGYLEVPESSEAFISVLYPRLFLVSYLWLTELMDTRVVQALHCREVVVSSSASYSVVLRPVLGPKPSCPD